MGGRRPCTGDAPLPPRYSRRPTDLPVSIDYILPLAQTSFVCMFLYVCVYVFCICVCICMCEQDATHAQTTTALEITRGEVALLEHELR